MSLYFFYSFSIHAKGTQHLPDQQAGAGGEWRHAGAVGPPAEPGQRRPHHLQLPAHAAQPVGLRAPRGQPGRPDQAAHRPPHRQHRHQREHVRRRHPLQPHVQQRREQAALRRVQRHRDPAAHHAPGRSREQGGHLRAGRVLAAPRDQPAPAGPGRPGGCALLLWAAGDCAAPPVRSEQVAAAQGHHWLDEELGLER